MARPIWKGHISFGLVNVPVTLYSAENRNDLSFRMLDSRNKARVRYERVNEATGEEVPWDSIVKAYEYDGGQYVVLSDEDFKRAAAEASKTVEIEAFVDASEISPAYFDKPYYLTPGKKGEKGYALLRETLRRTGKVGIAKVVIRSREYLAALIPEGDMLLFMMMRFHQELRDPAEYEVPTEKLTALGVSEKEVKMAEKLVEAMADEWNPEKFHDEYRDQLMDWINKKIEAGDFEGAPETADEEEEVTASGKVVDMMSLLKKSLKARGGADDEDEGAGDEEPQEKPQKAKKGAAGSKKSPAKKKPAEKKAPTRKRAAG